MVSRKKALSMIIAHLLFIGSIASTIPGSNVSLPAPFLKPAAM